MVILSIVDLGPVPRRSYRTVDTSHYPAGIEADTMSLGPVGSEARHSHRGRPLGRVPRRHWPTGESLPGEDSPEVSTQRPQFAGRARRPGTRPRVGGRQHSLPEPRSRSRASDGHTEDVRGNASFATTGLVNWRHCAAPGPRSEDGA